MIYIIYFFTCFVACSPVVNNSFNSNVLTSSRGEKIFVNSVNYGVTGDYQLSIISKDSLRLKNRTDTIGSIEGLNPFIYKFKNDTLTLFFYQKIKYKVQDEFNSVTVIYKIINEEEHLELSKKAEENNEYFSVPIHENIKYPSDMPKPSEPREWRLVIC